MTTQEIQNIVSENTVVIFGKGEKHEPRCGFTKGVFDVFDELFPNYVAVNVLGNRELQKTLCEFSAWPTFPQVYVHGEFIGGHDITVEMADEGELFSLLSLSQK